MSTDSNRAHRTSQPRVIATLRRRKGVKTPLWRRWGVVKALERPAQTRPDEKKAIYHA